jgi:hypothetical protein
MGLTQAKNRLLTAMPVIPFFTPPSRAIMPDLGTKFVSIKNGFFVILFVLGM